VFFIYQNVCLLLLLYIHIFNYISQGSVETYLRCGGIYYNSIIANYSLSVLAKMFENRSIIGEDI